MMGRLQVAGYAQELTPPPQLLMPVGLALLCALPQRQAARDRPDFQEVHRLVVDGQAETEAQMLKAQVAQIGPGRRHGIVVVDGFSGHGATPTADAMPR